jgi:hypothetical protein
VSNHRGHRESLRDNDFFINDVLLCDPSEHLRVLCCYIGIFLDLPQMATDFPQIGNYIILCINLGICNPWFYMYFCRFTQMATDGHRLSQ